MTTEDTQYIKCLERNVQNAQKHWQWQYHHFHYIRSTSILNVSGNYTFIHYSTILSEVGTADDHSLVWHLQELLPSSSSIVDTPTWPLLNDTQPMSYKLIYYIIWKVKSERPTFPPWAPRTAKQKSVDGDAFPGMENCEKAAAWPSIGWLTLRSTEYSCIAPTTRFVCTVNRPTSDGI